MKQEIVLPKFKLPGQEPNWFARGLWIAGGLVVVQLAVLGVVLLKKGPAKATAAAPVAEQRPLVAMETPPRAAVPAVPPTTPQPASVATETAPASAPAEAAATKPTSSRERASRSSRRSSRSGKMVAKASSSRSGGSSASAARPATAAKNDAIDELLKKFK